jgi:hypothetical protein
MLIAELKDNQLGLFQAGSKLATLYYEDGEIKGLYHTNEEVVNLDDLRYGVKIFKTGKKEKYLFDENTNQIKLNMAEEEK